MVLPAADLVQLESLFQLLPKLGLSSPIHSTLHALFEPAARFAAEPVPADSATLGARLKSGSPIRSVVLHAATPKSCSTLEQSFGLPVHYYDGDLDGARLRRRFCAAPTSVSPSLSPALDVPPSLVVEQFGPLVLLVSALWGRVGSSVIFDAQTTYLTQKGFIVARFLIDHYPRTGFEREKRTRSLLAENFEHVHPHLCFVAERNEDPSFLSRLSTSVDFQRGSPVRRLCMMFQSAKLDDRQGAMWCADRAIFAIVNHLPHVAFAKELTSAPIVLETHDVHSNLLTSHGIPSFVPKGPDYQALRETEEAEVWRGVAACANLSPEDHAIISRVAKRSFLARPYVNQTSLRRRSWLEVTAANGLPDGYKTNNHFDIMLWGDWHGGNVAGVRWFLDEVLDTHPRLQRATIVLVGRVRDELPPTPATAKSLRCWVCRPDR